MKFLLFDFECPNGHVFEDMVKPHIHEAPCPECKLNGARLISTPRIDPRLGTDAAGFPTMGDKWAKTRVQRRRVEERREREHGPDSWGASGADVIR